ncbi:RES domain-containing protein [Rhodanobacter sp. L36]|uniref:RES domain-containing protein n=1 Tax=Rhodanobacter sp. L36 TaxID=1747221 RepID=UPI00131D08C3|nr:RES domain-containing protein [Rhodanobacter sp. L36]
MKEGLILDDERGWRESDKHVCPRCVDDDYLRKLVRDDLTARACDYCGRRSRSPIAARVNVLLEAIYPTVDAYFNEPNDAGVPFDEGEYLVEPWSMEEIFESLNLEERPELMQDLINADIYDGGRVPAADGHWASSHEHDMMMASWQHFTHTVKHVTRYHFANIPPSESSEPGDVDICNWLPALAKRLRPLVVTLGVSTEVFRARIRWPDEHWSPTADQLTAPPSAKMKAGRMNPAGIRYLYTSFDRLTAMREVGVDRSTTDPVYVASFKLTRPLHVVDLTKPVCLPSVFDLAQKGRLERARFHYGFVREVSKRVVKNNLEHLSYVPTQVVCEYLAQVFMTKGGHRLDGLIYPSSVHKGGCNLVVFPSQEGLTEGFHGVTFNGSTRRRLKRPAATA